MKFEKGDVCVWKPKRARAGYFGVSHPDAERSCEVIVSSGPSKKGDYLCEFISEADKKALMPKSGRLAFESPVTKKKGNAGTASILIPFGRKNIGSILSSNIKGEWYQ